MSLTFGSHSSSKTMGFGENKEVGPEEHGIVTANDEEITFENKALEKIRRQMSDSSSCYTTDEEADDEGKHAKVLDLGPQLTIKEQLEKDKDDESLRKWKEQLLGSLDLNSVGENLEPEVKILSISISSPGRPELVLPFPMVPNSKGLWFTLKEGSQFGLKFTFLVSNNIVSGLTYTNTVWKTGIKVESKKEMIGTFSPQPEPYTHEIADETTPSGLFARGTYSARTKFIDDDKKCHLEINYSFDIRKDWASTTS